MRHAITRKLALLIPTGILTAACSAPPIAATDPAAPATRPAVVIVTTAPALDAGKPIYVATATAPATQPDPPELRLLRAAKAPPDCVWLENLDLSMALLSRPGPQPGPPLSFRPGRDVRGRSLQLAGTIYPHGIGTQAVSRFAVDLKGAAVRFLAVVGIDDMARGIGAARFTVWIDGNKVVDTGVMHYKDGPRLISVDLRGAHKLALAVDHGDTAYYSDISDWAGALLEMDPMFGTEPEAAAPPDFLLDQPPKVPGQYLVRFPCQVNGHPYPGRYAIFLPDDFGTVPEKKYPLILFLGGLGEIGVLPEKVIESGLPRLLEVNPEFRKNFQFIVLSPQLVDMRWEDVKAEPYVAAMLDAVCKEYPVDPSRVYVTGFSNGGTGSWHLAMALSGRFAAAAPMCGRVFDAQSATVKLKDLPVWAFVGDSDRDFTKGTYEMVTALKSVDAPVRLTIIPNGKHGIWDPIYVGHDLYAWLLSNTLGHPGPRVASDADKFAPGATTMPAQAAIPGAGAAAAAIPGAATQPRPNPVAGPRPGTAVNPRG